MVVADSVFRYWDDRFAETKPRRVAEYYWRACVRELKTLKPGNVHRHAEGHGMTVENFLTSAFVTAPIISDPTLKLSERILHSVNVTQKAVAMNTNLGTILLCAPIATAIDHGSSGDLRLSISDVIKQTGIGDAEEILEAIRLAAPSGLSEVDMHDVREPASANIHTIMNEARSKDMIARQYSDGFGEIFGFGFRQIEEGTTAGLSDCDVVTKVYLGYLSQFPDTHIVRQHGISIAEDIRKNAGQFYRDFESESCAEALRERLMHADATWKANDINPGTSADLTVATIFAYAIENSAKQSIY